MGLFDWLKMDKKKDKKSNDELVKKLDIKEKSKDWMLLF